LAPGNSGFEIAFKYRKIYGSLSEINNSNSIGIAGIMAGKKKKIYLGNLDAKRDWGYGSEYTEALWLMLQQNKPDDYDIGTGKTHSVKEFLEGAFSYLSLD
jgi:GDPmannose 4,6-dehydratase